MPDEQTNPNPDVEANQPPVETANLDNESLTTEPTEPSESQEPESYTPEQIAEWKQGSENNATTQAEFTRQRQDYTRMQEELDRVAQANSVLMGREQERVDPLVAVRRQLAQSYDENERYALEEQRDTILMQRATQGAAREALQAIEAQKALGGTDPNELARFEQGLGYADRVRMLKLMQAEKNGTLYDNLHTEREATQAEAARAAQLNTPLGQGGYSGMPPGALQNRQAPTMNNITFGMLSAEKRQSVLDAGIKIVNQQGEEVSLD